MYNDEKATIDTTLSVGAQRDGYSCTHGEDIYFPSFLSLHNETRTNSTSAFTLLLGFWGHHHRLHFLASNQLLYLLGSSQLYLQLKKSRKTHGGLLYRNLHRNKRGWYHVLPPPFGGGSFGAYVYIALVGYTLLIDRYRNGNFFNDCLFFPQPLAIWVSCLCAATITYLSQRVKSIPISNRYRTKTPLYSPHPFLSNPFHCTSTRSQSPHHTMMRPLRLGRLTRAQDST